MQVLLKNISKKKDGIMGVGMPQSLKLESFGKILFDVFNNFPYHVGSSLTTKSSWRDVDIRVILPDKEYEIWGLGDPEQPFLNHKWVGLVRAFSALGKEITDLPIDFQIQQQTRANKMYPNRSRSALGISLALTAKDKKKDKIEGVDTIYGFGSIEGVVYE